MTLPHDDQGYRRNRVGYVINGRNADDAQQGLSGVFPSRGQAYFAQMVDAPHTQQSLLFLLLVLVPIYGPRG